MILLLRSSPKQQPRVEAKEVFYDKSGDTHNFNFKSGASDRNDANSPVTIKHGGATTTVVTDGVNKHVVITGTGDLKVNTNFK